MHLNINWDGIDAAKRDCMNQCMHPTAPNGLSNQMMILTSITFGFKYIRFFN